MIRVRKFNPADVDLLCPVAIDIKVRENPQDWQKWVKLNSIHAVTALIGDTVIFAAGIRLGTHKDGTIGNLWAISTPEVKKHKREVLTAARLLIKLWIKNYKLKWLYSESRKGFKESQTLLRHCGFVRTDIETPNYYIYKLGGN